MKYKWGEKTFEERVGLPSGEGSLPLSLWINLYSHFETVTYYIHIKVLKFEEIIVFLYDIVYGYYSMWNVRTNIVVIL